MFRNGGVKVPPNKNNKHHPLINGSIYKWVYDTIVWFKDRDRDCLIIRCHPSEKIYRSQFSVYDYIKDKFPTIPRNVKVIPSSSKISTYKLFPVINVGIVSNSTVGLELVMSGVPVITVGQAHYKGKGFTYDANDFEEYKKYLNTPLRVENKDMMELYSHYYFIKSFIPFTLLYQKNFLNLGFHFKSYDEMMKDKHLNHIVDCIEGKKLFQEW